MLVLVLSKLIRSVVFTFKKCFLFWICIYVDLYGFCVWGNLQPDAIAEQDNKHSIIKSPGMKVR